MRLDPGHPLYEYRQAWASRLRALIFLAALAAIPAAILLLDLQPAIEANFDAMAKVFEGPPAALAALYVLAGVLLALLPAQVVARVVRRGGLPALIPFTLVPLTVAGAFFVGHDLVARHWGALGAAIGAAYEAHGFSITGAVVDAFKPRGQDLMGCLVFIFVLPVLLVTFIVDLILLPFVIVLNPDVLREMGLFGALVAGLLLVAVFLGRRLARPLKAAAMRWEGRRAGAALDLFE